MSGHSGKAFARGAEALPQVSGNYPSSVTRCICERPAGAVRQRR